MQIEVVKNIKNNLFCIDFNFSEPPVIVGGRAMEFYDLRKSGEDIDLIVTDKDYQLLSERFPDNRKDIWGDLGVVLWPFEIWRSIMYFDYEFYCQEAVECEGLKIISLERLLLTRIYAMNVDKYKRDIELIKNRFLEKNANHDFLKYSHERTSLYEKQAVIFAGKYDEIK